MRTLSSFGRVVVVAAVTCVWGMLTFACSEEDENPATTRPRGPDSSTTGDGTAGGDDSGNTPAGLAVCDKYGGYEGVKTLAANIVNNAKADCRIGPVVTSVANQNTLHQKECWEKWMGNTFVCPGVTFKVNETTDSKNEKCATQFGPLPKLSDLDFNAFIEDQRATFTTANFTADEIKGLAPAFEGLRTLFTTGTKIGKTKYTLCAANCTTAKPPEACIPLVIDAGPDAPNDTGPADTGSTIQDTGTDG